MRRTGTFILALLILALCTQCTLAPTRTPYSSNPKATKKYRAWDPIFEAALNFPIVDYDIDEGYIESDWIYTNKHSRYRFFIFVSDANNKPYDVDILSQKRKSNLSNWQWILPTLDLRENLKKLIHEKIQKYRSS